MFAYLDQGNEQDLEANVPFLWTAQYAQARGLAQDRTLFVLKGYARLSPEYLQALEQRGIHALDVQDEHQRNLARLQPPSRYNSYRINNFSRWLILKEFIRRERIRDTVVHVDGDVVFNVPPRCVYDDVRGKTFVLQGCPALTVLSDWSWFDQYESQLQRFFADPERFEAEARKQRPADVSHATHDRWAGAWERQFRGDQDFISYLIHSGQLVQDAAATFARGLEFFYAQNPLYAHDYIEQQLGPKKVAVTRREGKIYFGDKPIAFWHFQNAFTSYIRLAWFFQRFRLPFRCVNPREAAPRFKRLLTWVNRNVLPNRRAVYRAIQELDWGDSLRAQLALTQLYSGKRYWLPGAFH